MKTIFTKFAAAKIISLAISLAFSLVFASLAPAQTPIKVLFWGGQDNASPPHLPRNLRDTLAPYFLANNVEMHFRESSTHSWVTLDSLNQFDVIMVYAANRGSGFTGGSDITTTQMTALTQWIASGRVFAVFHGSSNAYQSTSNAAWRQLLGAQFLDHGPNSGTGFAGTISFTHPEHPSLVGTTCLPTSAAASGGSPYWDEGRRHQNYSSDTVVIARSQLSTTVNVPWIWVRPQGNGWVYYNSSGHDGETWRRSEFKGQVLKVLQWGKTIKTTGIRGERALRALLGTDGNDLVVPFKVPYRLEVSDLQGRSVFSRGHSSAAVQNLGFLPPGTYGVQLQPTVGEAITTRFRKNP